MASQARVWCYQAGGYIIAFKPKFNQVVLKAMQSADPTIKRNGFDLFRRGLCKIFKPRSSHDQDNSEIVYVCIFNPTNIMTKQHFERYLALGTKDSEVINASLLAKFAGIIPNTQAAIQEAYADRFERNEEVLASTLRAVLHLYDSQTWPMPQSLPPICAFQYNKGFGFSTRARLKPTLERWNEALQRNARSPEGSISCNQEELGAESVVTSDQEPEIEPMEIRSDFVTSNLDVGED